MVCWLPSSASVDMEQMHLFSFFLKVMKWIWQKNHIIVQNYRAFRYLDITILRSAVMILPSHYQVYTECNDIHLAMIL